MKNFKWFLGYSNNGSLNTYFHMRGAVSYGPSCTKNNNIFPLALEYLKAIQKL